MSSIFDIINIPLGWIMRLCYSLTNNYLLALLLFSVILQIVLLPLAIKQQRNSVRQAQLAPKLAALRKKYAGRNDAATQQKMQEETMALYKRENFSPFSAFGTLLIQMPVLLALYNVVMNPLRYITGLTVDQITELNTYMTDTLGFTFNLRGQFIEMLNRIRENVSQYVSIVPDIAERPLPDMMLGSLDLSATPTFTIYPDFDWLLLIPILTFVFALLMQTITRRFTYQSPEVKEQQKSLAMKILNYSMPLLSVWIAFSVPASIGIYWIFRNILQTVQQVVLSKLIPVPQFTEEDYKAAEKEMKAGRAPREKSKIPPRSLHHIDDEEYQARYEAAVNAAKAAEEGEKKAASGDGAEKKPAPALKESAADSRSVGPGGVRRDEGSGSPKEK